MSASWYSSEADVRSAPRLGLRGRLIQRDGDLLARSGHGQRQVPRAFLRILHHVRERSVRVTSVTRRRSLVDGRCEQRMRELDRDAAHLHDPSALRVRQPVPFLDRLDERGRWMSGRRDEERGNQRGSRKGRQPAAEQPRRSAGTGRGCPRFARASCPCNARPISRAKKGFPPEAPWIRRRSGGAKSRSSCSRSSRPSGAVAIGPTVSVFTRVPNDARDRAARSNRALVYSQRSPRRLRPTSVAARRRAHGRMVRRSTAHRRSRS